MEGLIPLVFRAIKKNKTRSQYRCLSKGNAQTYNIADFYGYDVANQHHDGDDDQGDEERDRVGKFYSPQIERHGEPHRRSMSTGYKLSNFKYEHDQGNNINGMDHGFSTSPPNMQLKRYSSHRMFSCVTGAN